MKSHYHNPSAVVRVSGPDAYTFLQGQFTNDLNHPPGRAVYGLWLNQKGRVVGDSTVLRLAAAEFLAVSQHTPSETLRRRIEDYIVADEVTVVDETGNWSAVKLWAEGTVEYLQQLAGGPPAVGTFIHHAGRLIFSGRYTAEANHGVLLPRGELDALRAGLSAMGAFTVTDEEAEGARIAAGLPVVPGDIGPDDLPNEGGFEVTAISYTKGCYLGQEVMSRLKNLGRIRRRLHLVRGAGPPPARLTLVYQNAARAGEIRSAARDGDGFVALAMLGLAALVSTAGLAFAPGKAPELQIVRAV